MSKLPVSECAQGFVEDFERLIHAFCHKKSTLWSVFEATLIEQKFDCLFDFRLNDRECREFTEECMRIVAIYLLPPCLPEVRICSLFMLYTLFSTHPFPTPVSIRLLLSQWRELKAFMQELQSLNQHIPSSAQEEDGVISIDDVFNNIGDFCGDKNGETHGFGGLEVVGGEGVLGISDLFGSEKTGSIGNISTLVQQQQSFNKKAFSSHTTLTSDVTLQQQQLSDNYLSQHKQQFSQQTSHSQSLLQQQQPQILLQQQPQFFIQQQPKFSLQQPQSQLQQPQSSQLPQFLIQQQQQQQPSQNQKRLQNYQDVLDIFNLLKQQQAFTLAPNEWLSSSLDENSVWESGEEEKVEFLMKRGCVLEKIVTPAVLQQLTNQELASLRQRHKELKLKVTAPCRAPSMSEGLDLFPEQFHSLIKCHEDRKRALLSRMPHGKNTGEQGDPGIVSANDEEEEEEEEEDDGRARNNRTAVLKKAYSSLAPTERFFEKKLRKTPKKKKTIEDKSEKYMSMSGEKLTPKKTKTLKARDKVDKVAKVDKVGKVAKVDRVSKVDKVSKVDRVDNVCRNDKKNRKKYGATNDKNKVKGSGGDGDKDGGDGGGKSGKSVKKFSTKNKSPRKKIKIAKVSKDDTLLEGVEKD